MSDGEKLTPANLLDQLRGDAEGVVGLFYHKDLRSLAATPTNHGQTDQNRFAVAIGGQLGEIETAQVSTVVAQRVDLTSAFYGGCDRLRWSGHRSA